MAIAIEAATHHASEIPRTTGSQPSVKSCALEEKLIKRSPHFVARFARVAICSLSPGAASYDEDD